MSTHGGALVRVVLGNAPYLLGLLLLVSPILLLTPLPPHLRIFLSLLPSLLVIGVLVMAVKAVIQGTVEGRAKAVGVEQVRTETRTEETTEEETNNGRHD